MTGARPVVRVAAPVRQQAVDALRDAIVRFDYAPGQRLVERDLTEALGVSRATLREALGELRSEGLIDLIPQRGAVVATLTPDEAADLYEVRIALEALVVERFARRAAPDVVDRLAEAVDEVGRAGAAGADITTVLQTKDDFFRILLEGAESEVLTQMINGIQARVRLLRATSMSAPGRNEQSVNELREVVQALRRRDGDRAVWLYVEHLRRASQISLARWGGPAAEDSTTAGETAGMIPATTGRMTP